MAVVIYGNTIERGARYFAPWKEIRAIRLRRGDLVSFQPAQGARKSAIALDVTAMKGQQGQSWRL